MCWTFASRRRIKTTFRVSSDGHGHDGPSPRKLLIIRNVGINISDNKKRKIKP